MGSSSFAFLDHPGILAFAHRGGAGSWPENTMPAFEGAVRLGYRYLETDVHVTADGELVAFHDHQLDRVTDRKGRISELTWREVAKARVTGADGTTAPIPLMAELLAAWPEVRFNIDPKHDDACQPLIDTILRGRAVDRVCIGSFSDRRLARLRARLGPRLCTSLGPVGITRLRAAGFGVPVGHLPSPCAQVPVGRGNHRLVDQRFVDTAHRLGMQVHVWTIDDPTEMLDLLDLGVDGIMTDQPAVLRGVLEARGGWVEG